MAAGQVRYILLTDIARSSYLWEAFPQAYPAVLEAHNHIVEGAVVQHCGVVMKNTGDGFFALFDSADEAVGAAVAIQLAFSGRNPQLTFPDETVLALRVVVHAGLLHQLAGQEGDWFGPPLNRAARICGVCHAGQLLVSGPVRRALAGDPPAGCDLTDIGLVRLRDLGEPEQLLQLTHPGFEQRSFPPLLTLDSVPNNLAVQPNAFVGRERELADLSALLSGEARLLTLQAPGGYGKTRLATQLAAQRLGRFANGVFFVDLAPVKDYARLSEAIADATGYQFFGNREPQQQILDYLRAKEMLLVFDNFEHVLDGSDLVGEIMRTAPKVKIITTTREPLRLAGEIVYPVEPLPTGAGSDSVQLFADRAAQVKPGLELEDETALWVERICTRLDGVPLSIELTAAWANSFTLPEMYAELGQQLELTARMIDLPERQRSVRASCDWSWNLLTAEQQTALMQVSTFRGGFFVSAAGAVLGTTGLKLRGLLAGLCDKSWLYAREVDAQTRYAIRDAAAREYASEKLYATRDNGSAAGLYEQTVSSHAGYFASLVDREGPRLNGAGLPDGGAAQQAALRTWKLELANIYETLETGYSCGRADWLQTVARWLHRYLDMTSGFSAMRERYAQLLDAAQRLQSQELEARAQLSLARANLWLGDFAASRSAAEAAREIAESLGDRQSVATAQGTLGHLEYYQGRSDTAQELYSDALAISRELGARQGEAISLNSLGNLKWNQGSYAEAREMYAQGLAIFSELGDRYGEALCLNNLGGIEVSQGNYDAARELYHRSIAIKGELDDRYGRALTLNNLGSVETSQGNYRVARDLYDQSMLIRHDLGDRYGEALCLNNLGVVEHYQGNDDGARERYAEALVIRQQIGDKPGMSISCAASALALAILDQPRLAAIVLSATLRAVRELGYHFGADDMRLVAAARERLDAGVAAGRFSADELAQWQAAGEALDLEQLADFTLQALRQAQPGRPAQPLEQTA